MTRENGDPETFEEALELFQDDLVQMMQHRSPWLEVAAVPNIRGHGGYDIVLRLDGTYYGVDVDTMLEFTRWQFLAACARSGLRKRPGDFAGMAIKHPSLS